MTGSPPPIHIDSNHVLGSGSRPAAIARDLYESIATVPILSPHTHVPVEIFADPGHRFGSPVDLFVGPDHYVIRLLYSQGIPMEQLGFGGRGETDDRRIWATFARNFHLFAGTPSRIWLEQSMATLFGIEEPLNAANAAASYELIVSRLAGEDMTPRATYDRFGITFLATTDGAVDSLDDHRTISGSGWSGSIAPTFRPDGIVDIDRPGWGSRIERLEDLTGVSVGSYADYIRAIEERRRAFKELGAVATDHGVTEPWTCRLDDRDAEEILQRALRGAADPGDARRFRGHMLIEMARMSVEDGLVMQVHAGALRDHNTPHVHRYGPDLGADIPVVTEFTRNLRPLLEEYGNDQRLTLVLFTLDESAYSRDLAPLAGHYPAVRLGPPWWFYDSVKGITRYLDRVVETAGFSNLAGFNDDARSFPSIAVRHDLWRRTTSRWLADQVTLDLIDYRDAETVAMDLAIRLAARTYHVDLP